MNVKLTDLFGIVRNFLFSKANKEFLIFLFFLVLSGIFWMMMTLDESYEKELSIPVHITHVPKDVVLLSGETDTIRVTVRDRGIDIVSYIYDEPKKTLNINFKNYDKGDGQGSVSANELQQMIAKLFRSSTKVLSTNPGKYVFFYNTGAHKRVPVRWSGRVIPEQLYFLSHATYSPDSVTIFASEEKLDSIKTVYTEALNCVGFRDTLSIDCRIRKTEGVKTVPDHTRVTFYTDVLTEESMDGIPVQGIHMPKGKVLRTFPAKVKVNFVTGVSVFRKLKPSDFVVIADYNELKSNPSEKCNIYLRKTPDGISRAALTVNQVDYLIEEEEEDSE